MNSTEEAHAGAETSENGRDRSVRLIRSSWSIADPAGPFRAIRWLAMYFAFVTFVVPMVLLVAAFFPGPAYHWLMYWWPWTLFLIVATWTVDNAVVYLRCNRKLAYPDS